LADHYGKVLDGKTSTILKSSLPRFLRGPLYNIASCFKKYSFGEDYVCEKLRNGICVWLEQRRFLNDNEPPKGDVLRRLEKMNGIDFGYYSRTPFHVWAGIFPAGADRFSEYRALDPWWYQYWPNEWVQRRTCGRKPVKICALNIFTVLNWILKLAVICLYSEEQAQQFYEVVIAWLNGTTTDDILDKVIPNTGSEPGGGTSLRQRQRRAGWQICHRPGPGTLEQGSVQRPEIPTEQVPPIRPEWDRAAISWPVRELLWHKAPRNDSRLRL